MFIRHRQLHRELLNLLRMRTKRYYVYILASKGRVLYVGMTGFLMSRILQHKAKQGGQFSSKYRVDRLVYYEAFQHVRLQSAARPKSRNGGERRKLH